MPFTIFISHGPDDIDVVRFIASQLQLGGQRPLIAHEDRPPKAARSLPKRIRERILESGCVLALISNQGSQSDLVRQEVEFASDKRPIIPILRGSVSAPRLDFLRGAQIIRFSGRALNPSLEGLISWTPQISVKGRQTEALRQIAFLTLGALMTWRLSGQRG